MTPAEGEALVAAVERRYAKLDPPSWPDPHQGELPAEEEYSRVTDPERYVVVRHRVHAWVDELAARGAEVSPVETAPLGPTRRVAVPRPGTSALFVQEVHEPGFPDVVRFALGDPRAGFADVPDGCACDACDSGSESLLMMIDEVFVAAVAGLLEVEITDSQLRVRSPFTSSEGTHGGRVPALTGRWSGAEWFPDA